MEIQLKSIGRIQTPFQRPEELPRQGVLKPECEGRVVLDKSYWEGLDGMDQFSHAVLIFYFHQSDQEMMRGTPPGASKSRGVFAIRGPHRPNHLGLSVVKIKQMREDGFVFSGVDMLDGTPLVDIKPYVQMLEPGSQQEGQLPGEEETHK